MCGLAGFFKFSRQAEGNFDLEGSTRRLLHRGPDEEGYYQDEQAGLGVCRLSIIDLQGGRQPIPNETKNVWVAFNGEIYNYRELRRDLENRGHAFATRSDTEVLVHGYEEWGEELPLRLRGMFAFAIYDQRSAVSGQRSAVGGRLFLARDHFGIKPLYYTRVDGSLLFASEIKSILSDPRVSREIDREAIDPYLSLLYIPEPRTIFRSIRSLPPAHRLVCEEGDLRISRYWDFEPQHGRYANPEEAKEEILSALEDSVRSMLVADVPLGLFLSGGMDSASILALMARHTQEPVQTFSLGFGHGEKSWDELEPASRIASFFRAEHHEFRVTPDIVQLLPRVIRHFDQPFANPTALLLYLLSGETRRYVKVALAGTGGDEMFAGYPRYPGMLLYQRYRHLPEVLRRLAVHYAGYLRYNSLEGSLKARRIRRFLEGGMLTFEDCYLHFLEVMDRKTKEEAYTPAFRNSLETEDPLGFLRSLLRGGNGLPPSEKLMIADVQSYLPFNQLAYGDRMSMAQSLEVRVPFVDQRLIQVAGGIPLSWKLRGGRTKGLFREAMTSLLPTEVLKYPKRGLNLPLSTWLRGELFGWMKTVLSAERIEERGYFRPDAVESLIEEHRSGRQDHSLFLWALIVLEEWHRIYVDQEPGLEEDRKCQISKFK
jgi:asparagine synthase (glutamine-hydrolysing)